MVFLRYLVENKAQYKPLYHQVQVSCWQQFFVQNSRQKAVNCQCSHSISDTHVDTVAHHNAYSLHSAITRINLHHTTSCFMTGYALYLRAPKSWPTANLICCTEPKKNKTVMKKSKNWDAKKKWSSQKVDGVSPKAGKDSTVGKICDKGRFWSGNERQRELWLVRVVSWQSEKM